MELLWKTTVIERRSYMKGYPLWKTTFEQIDGGQPFMQEIFHERKP